MFQKVLNNIGIFQKISYTLWNMSLIISHPPSLLGHCPKFDRFVFLMASLMKGCCDKDVLQLGMLLC
jgi:hypothetical protein